MLSSLAAVAVLATTTAHHPRHFPHHPECASVKCAHAADKAFNRHERKRLARIFHTATASVYDDTGETACETHYPYGFAHLGPGEGAYPGMACGTRIRICAHSCVTATMQDHGPYIEGREFDLNYSLKNAIGASDLGTIRWHRMR